MSCSAKGFFHQGLCRVKVSSISQDKSKKEDEVRKIKFCATEVKSVLILFDLQVLEPIVYEPLSLFGNASLAPAHSLYIFCCYL